MKSNQKPDPSVVPGEMRVTDYSDYRRFLLDHLQRMVQHRSSFSIGAWARVLGLKTTSSLAKILRGEREPGPRLTQRLVLYFRFVPSDASYFRELLLLAKLRQDPNLQATMMRGLELKRSVTSIRNLDPETFALVSRWYCLCIRELARLPGFKEDPRWISERFLLRVAPSEVEEAIRALLKAGLVSRDAQGHLRATDSWVRVSSESLRAEVMRYQEELARNAARAVQVCDPADREFEAATLVLDRTKLPEAKRFIREFRQRFCLELGTGSGDAVFQLQLALFRVAS